MGQRIKNRRDTSANWAANNPILADGEHGYDKDLKKSKVGDGITAWNALGWQQQSWADITDKPTLAELKGEKGDTGDKGDKGDMGVAGLEGMGMCSGYNANYWYGYGYSSTSSTVVLVANRIYFIPFVCGKSTTFTRLGVEVTTAIAGATAKLGIYKLIDGVPDELALDAGTVDAASNGLKELVINALLEKGFYCLVVKPSHAITCRYAVYQAGQAIALLGSATTSSGGSVRFQYIDAAAGALPAIAPAITNDVAGNAPAIWLRKV